TGSGNIPIYSTYIGGENYDGGYGVAVDVSGNAFVTGLTTSSNFPTQNEYQAYQGGSDVFIFKLSSSGNNLTYSTFLGGTNQDVAYDIAIGDSGNAYVTGWTNSLDFPTLNPCQTRQGGGDAFVSELSSWGSSLTYSTYLGGGKSTLKGTGDAFVTKLSRTGGGLVYSTYLGGGSGEGGNSVAVDCSGSAYVTGTTNSSDFPAKGPYQSTLQGLQNAFVTKLSSEGNSLIYSTYLGGGDYDEGYGIAVDGGGNAYVTGYSSSVDFPTWNHYQTDQGGYDAFVTKLSGSGNSLIYSTYLGDSDWDVGAALAVDNSGNAYLTGNTLSYDYPTRNQYQTYQGGLDAFVTKMTWTPDYVCGDANADEQVNLLDAVFLIDYIFVGGPAPQSLSLADVNCSGGTINIADVVLLINYIFRAGPAPCDGCK
ncbi:MAG: SBBP repeat-containing protein, partial [candidate division Zixibacteria bacterium]|nr:SBBP repeat-containing protein [candidate division Zixibacteria bacterium]